MSKELEKAEEPVLTDRLERLIWKSAGRKSIRKLAEETGLDAAYLLRVRNEMLDSVDDLTVRQKRTKLLVELEEIAEKAREDAEDATYEFKAGLLNSAVAAMKTILVELNRTAKGEQEAIDRLNQLRINELIRLIELSVAKTFAVISERHDISEEELFDVFQGYLKPAAQEIEG